jgi:hypothetical protein
VCDLETSRMGAPYIYIYDISRLRVKYIISYHINGSISSTVIFYKMSEVKEVQIENRRQKHNLKHDTQ